MKRIAAPLLTIGLLASLLVLPTSAQRRGRPFRPGAESQAAASPSAGTESVSIVFQGTPRRYLLHVPEAASGALVLAFHGGSETPENLEATSGFSMLSDRERFIVAYPAGVGKSWADGRGSTVADQKAVDDVGFTRAVVADIARTHMVDRSRVFATGPSNGGIFANRLGCEASDLFAAIGPVIGAIATALAPTCHPGAPLAVIAIQGISDPVVPFNGGRVGGTLEGAAGGLVEGGRATQELWRSLDGCAATPLTTTEPPRVQDGTSVTRRAFSGCRAGSDVVWYEVEGAGHRWYPNQSHGVQELIARRALGISSQNINASETLWQFFAEHPRK